MKPKLHVLQGEGVGRNKMPTRRIEVSGVTGLDALVEAHEGQPIADLITPLVPAAQRLAYAMLQNAHDCEDAVQEATFKGLRVEITEVPTHE
ncbi:MAG TPA: hypothetical protein VIJ58_09180 [Candidatus Dormibacteraeota bacterium]